MALRVRIQEWNRKIQQTIECGLAGKWLKDLENKKKKYTHVGIRPLKAQDFYGALLICLLLLILAILALIFELIVHHKLKNRNSSRWWKNADWIIDGRRHIRITRAEKWNQFLQVPIRTYQSRVRHFHHIRPCQPLNGARPSQQI